jgi:acyl-CoA thioesterase-2
LSDSGQEATDELVAILDLEPIEKDIFRGGNPEGTRLHHVFGGQVAAQALMAAGRTVEPDRAVHSLHSYFIRRGDPLVPIVFTVDRIRDGGSFTTRRVVAVQRGQGIFALEASFQLDQAGIEHQVPMPIRPSPESLAISNDVEVADMAEDSRPFLPRWPFERREVPVPPGSVETTRGEWIRTTGKLPDDPLLHACAMTYASDLIPATAVLKAHGLAVGDGSQVRVASLDHVVWFHRPFRADQWLLYESESPMARGSRGLATARVFTEDGQQVATLAQEIMIRLRNPPA